MANSVLLSAPTERGFLLRVVGRGTFTESPIFREFVTRCLDMKGKPSVVVDVTRCDYVDSTFMGCLIWLHKFAESGARLKFYASPEKSRELFGYCMLDLVLNIVDTCPAHTDEFVVLTMVDIETSELGRHIAECHRQLAKLGEAQSGPTQSGPKESARFQSIADRLDRDLKSRF
jgi:anti-anti-sigma regulatory factor